MKRFLSAIALTCVLAISVLAGDITTAGFTSPPPPPGDLPTSGVMAPAPSGPTSPGDLPTGGFAQELSDAALSGLLTALQLLAF